MYVYLQRNEIRNSLYHVSEVLHGRALLLSLHGEKSNEQLGWDDLVIELYQVSALFLNVADCLMDMILEHNSIELRIDGPEEVQIKGLRSFQDIKIPWFTDTAN